MSTITGSELWNLWKTAHWEGAVSAKIAQKIAIRRLEDGLDPLTITEQGFYDPKDRLLQITEQQDRELLDFVRGGVKNPNNMAAVRTTADALIRESLSAPGGGAILAAVVKVYQGIQAIASDQLNRLPAGCAIEVDDDPATGDRMVKFSRDAGKSQKALAEELDQISRAQDMVKWGRREENARPAIHPWLIRHLSGIPGKKGRKVTTRFMIFGGSRGKDRVQQGKDFPAGVTFAKDPLEAALAAAAYRIQQGGYPENDKDVGTKRDSNDLFKGDVVRFKQVVTPTGAGIISAVFSFLNGVNGIDGHIFADPIVVAAGSRKH